MPKLTELPIEQWRVAPMPDDPSALLVCMHADHECRVWTIVRLAEPLPDQVKKQHDEART